MYHLCQFLALWRMLKLAHLLSFDIIREVRSSFPTPTFLFFFLKLGVIYFREHKIYILTETGVQVAWSSETTG